jgi:hypothetical protein
LSPVAPGTHTCMLQCITDSCGACMLQNITHACYNLCITHMHATM